MRELMLLCLRNQGLRAAQESNDGLSVFQLQLVGVLKNGIQ